MKKFFTVAFLMFFMNINVYAAETESTIAEVRVHPTSNDVGSVYVIFDDMVGNSCPHNIHYAVIKNQNMFSQLYAMLLSAFHAGSKVKYTLTGCDKYGNPKLTHLRLVK